MATEQGTTANKNFDTQMRLHRRAWTPGTAEYAKRKDYPGDAARDHVCAHTTCLNNIWRHSKMETYWLCPDCSAVAPCTVTEFFTHAPYKILPPRKKQRAACSAAFSAWAHRRRRQRLPSPDPDKELGDISAGEKRKASD